LQGKTTFEIEAIDDVDTEEMDLGYPQVSKR